MIIIIIIIIIMIIIIIIIIISPIVSPKDPVSPNLPRLRPTASRTTG